VSIGLCPVFRTTNQSRMAKSYAFGLARWQAPHTLHGEQGGVCSVSCHGYGHGHLSDKQSLDEAQRCEGMELDVRAIPCIPRPSS
jgi:hypothetical protein